MEIIVKMELLGEEEEAVLIGVTRLYLSIAIIKGYIGRFSMVCRDAFTQKARPIPTLKLATPEEVALFNMGAGKNFDC